MRRKGLAVIIHFLSLLHNAMHNEALIQTLYLGFTEIHGQTVLLHTDTAAQLEGDTQQILLTTEHHFPMQMATIKLR